MSRYQTDQGAMLFVRGPHDYLSASGGGEFGSRALNVGELLDAIELETGDVVAIPKSGSGLLFIARSGISKAFSRGKFTSIQVAPDRRRFVAYGANDVEAFDGVTSVGEFRVKDPLVSVGWAGNDLVVSTEAGVELWSPNRFIKKLTSKSYSSVVSGADFAYAYDKKEVLLASKDWTLLTATPDGFNVSGAIQFGDNNFLVGTWGGTIYTVSKQGTWMRFARTWTAATKFRIAGGFVLLGTRNGEFQVLDSRTGELKTIVGLRGTITISAVWMNDNGTQIAVGSELSTTGPRSFAFFGERLATDKECDQSPAIALFRRGIGQ